MKQPMPSKFTVFETELMRELLKRAKQYEGFTHPNPLVAAAVYNNNDHINDYEGDGIIICTPTGSTGYSLSSGGPIVHSDLDVMTITPISSHSLSARPIVLSSNSNIKVKFSNNFADAALTIDGQTRIDLVEKNIISISKANFNAKLVELPFYNYMTTLKEKLHWSGNSR